MMFKDRQDAGEQLAKKLERYNGDKNAIVLGLPRGGVAVAAEVARMLGLPLDVVMARKIGAPDNPEFAIGAVSEEGEGVFDSETIAMYGISKEYLEEETKKQKEKASNRLARFRAGRPPLDISGKTAILVDDGVATGATMRAAIRSAKAKRAAKIVVATPVIAPDSLKRIQNEADEVFYLGAPESFAAVGQFYDVFPQTTDDGVVRLLQESASSASMGADKMKGATTV